MNDLSNRKPSLHGCLAACLLMSILPLGAALTNRWSFSNANGAAPAGSVIADSVSGQNAVIVGNGASFNSGSLTLPGTTTGNQTPATISAYIDLPNGLLSSKTNFTLEIWATPVADKYWQRLADFGRMDLTGNPAVQGTGAAPGEILSTATVAPGTGTAASDNLMLAINRGGLANNQQLQGQLDGGTQSSNITALPLPLGVGVPYHHFVIKFTDSPTGGQIAWYFNGTLATTVGVNFHLSSIEDVNNWLGRSQYSGDSQSNVIYNEVRLYNHAMSQAEITASLAAGPNPAYPLPVTANDAVTMHRGQKARIAVLANDTGGLINPTSVTILQAPQFGTAVPDSTGKILYTQTGGIPASDSFTYQVSGPGGTSSPATVAITFANTLRVANGSLNVPSTPPPVSIQAIDAFPGLAFTTPTCLATPPGDTQRLFVCTKGGTLSVIPNVTAATPASSSLLSLSAAAGGLFNGRLPAESLATASEQGFLGLAFHPNFASNGYCYIFYSVTVSGPTYERVSRLTLSNPTAAVPTVNLSSELILIQQLDDFTNHNGGDLHFGPDGYLYISLGDEGDQKDNGFNSQRIDKDYFSGLLRIDVNLEGDEIAGGNPAAPDDANLPPNTHASIPLYGGKPAYEVPVDNPFVGATSFNGLAVTPSAVRSEFWAVGLHNPWRFSFDTNGELWCGDVGGELREEVNVITRGGNYGWVYREGTTTGPYLTSNPPHAAPPIGFTPLDPLFDYTHGTGPAQGSSVVGGFVYRSTRLPGLTGAYIFADNVSGNVWSLTRNGTSPPTVTRILGKTGIAAFAADPSNGDVLMADHTGNRLLRIAAVTDTTTFPATLSATNLFADLTDLAPSPGLLPYSVNLPFWSDYAVKRRWSIVPGAGMLTWSRDGLWTFPTGQIWVQHLDLEMTRGDPATKKRIETRLLVKNAGGSYGVSYRWNDAGTDAALVSDSGDDFNLNLTVNGSPYTQRWSIPSRAQCATCHTPQAGHALSFNTRQLNRTNTINGFSGNQLDLLKNGLYFSNSPESPNLLPFYLAPDDANFPAEARVRSYLAVNCAYCHQPGGTAAPSAWDGRPEIPLDQTGLIDGAATNNGGNPLNKLVVPSDLTHSIIYNRVVLANGFTRMPPLATSELDPKAITLLTQWIEQALPAKKTYAQWRLEKFGSSSSPQGDPAADADADGRTNREEYLAATDPLSGSSFFTATPSWSGGQFHLNFLAPVNQSIQVETSSDLSNWTLWDVPGNQGTPRLGGPASLQGPASDAFKFFRLQLHGN